MTASQDAKSSASFPLRMAVGMFGFVALMLVLWLILPGGAVSVAILAVVALVGVFLGVGGVMQTRSLDEKPGRNPTPPPSATHS